LYSRALRHKFTRLTTSHRVKRKVDGEGRVRVWGRETLSEVQGQSQMQGGPPSPPSNSTNLMSGENPVCMQFFFNVSPAIYAPSVSYTVNTMCHRLKKAFDKIHHYDVSNKLFARLLPTNLLCIFENFAIIVMPTIVFVKKVPHRQLLKFSM
jgi:hypothetical protein